MKSVLIACAVIFSMSIQTAQAEASRYATFHYQEVLRPATDAHTQVGCVQLNYPHRVPELTEERAICFGSDWRSSDTSYFHLSVGEHFRYELEGNNDLRRWRHFGVGITGGVEIFMSTNFIHLKFSGNGTGHAGVNGTTTATVNDAEDSVTVDGNQDVVSGSGNFGGDAEGDVLFRFGFGAHAGWYAQLSNFYCEGGFHLDTIHSGPPGLYGRIGLRIQFNRIRRN